MSKLSTIPGWPRCRASLVATVVSLVCAGSLGAPAVASAANSMRSVSRTKHTAHVSLRASQSKLRFAVSLSAPGKASCLVLVSTQNEAYSFPTMRIGPLGHARLTWRSAKNAPSGRWTVGAQCGISGRIKQATTGITVRNPRSVHRPLMSAFAAQAAGELVVPSSVQVEGATMASAATAATVTNTGGYPYASMPCEHAPYAVSGSGYPDPYCANYDWGPKHTSAYNDSFEISPYGYAYRNCTDYVAWQLASLGVPASVYKGHGNGAGWASVPGLVTNTTPAVGAVAVQTSGEFGHVALITAVNGSTIAIAEYNYNENGTYDTRTGTLSSLGFNEVTHFETHESGNPRPPSAVGTVPSVGSSGTPTGLPPSPVGYAQPVSFINSNGTLDVFINSGSGINHYVKPPGGGWSGEIVASG